MNSMITTISSKNITAVIAAIILCLSIVLTACAPTELPNDSELPSVSDAQGTLQPTSMPDDRLSFKYSTEPLRDSVSGSAEEASNQPADAQPTTEPGKNSSALRVYLTFDDGPCKKTKRILSILDEYGIKASFFTVGYFIDRHPDIVVEMINSGHLVCCHTYSHEMRDIYASPASFMRDIERWTEAYKNPVDRMFEELEAREPNHFAVRQYKKYSIAAGKTAKSILVSCGARLAPFDIAELREITMYDELELDTLAEINVLKTHIVNYSKTRNVYVAYRKSGYSK